MEKESFQTLLRNFTSLSREEASELISLQSDFPYSQVIHNLCSRAAQDHMLDSREKFLHLSAIYTTDRAVLKSIMSATREDRKTDDEIGTAPTPDEETAVVKKSDQFVETKSFVSRTKMK